MSRNINFNSLADDAFLRKPDVLAVVGVSAATLYRMAASGRFPKPIRIGPNTSVWKWSEVKAWLKVQA